MKSTPFYLQSSGHANSNRGDGRLATAPVHGSAQHDRFAYDPAYPVVTLSAKTPGVNLGTYMGAYDRSEIESRQDVLIYSTEPLDEAVEVSGPVEAVLYLSSTAVDTDIDVTLVDVFPDGRAFGVCNGMLRARHRLGMDTETFLEPDTIYELCVDLQATSITFLKGHSIRLAITSSGLPFYERNMGTTGDNITAVDPILAENTIHHSDRHRSRLILPIVPIS
jgi:hypothetical protein